MRSASRTRGILTVGLVMAAASSALAQQSPAIVAQKDIIYCRIDGAALLTDIAYPASGSALPAMLYIHGGRWRSGSKDDIERGLNPQAWAENGFFAMSIEFRLVTSTPAPAAQQDLMCAIRWLHSHAAEYGVDPNRIYLSGWSSGGHQVALAATQAADAYEAVGQWEDARTDVRAVMSVSGAYDLESLPWGNFWTPLEGDSIAARRLASPIRQLSRESRPMLIVHSDNDGSVPIQQALDMVRALETAGVPHRFVHYTDRGHVALTQEVVTEMLAFIKEVEQKGW
jgi:acetyl esterase/lipase